VHYKVIEIIELQETKRRMSRIRRLVALPLYSLLLYGRLSEADSQPAATATIPDFVNKYGTVQAS
jgi:hypothetical protein